MKKVLIITYYWPPSGGAGVQRWLKLTKYLLKSGITPIVLSVDEKNANYPLIDSSLEKDINSAVQVYKTKSVEILSLISLFGGKNKLPHGGFSNVNKKSMSQRILRFIRGNFFIPDPRKGWNRFAIKKAIEIIKLNDIDTVITSSPPHSTQLIGLRLKQKLGINWIADLRDPWTDIYYKDDLMQTALAKSTEKKMELEVLEKADQLVVVSDSIKQLFASKSNNISADKIHVIPNGYDPDDFKDIRVKEQNEFIITYTGTIGSGYNSETFFKALDELLSNKDAKLKIQFIGSVDIEVQNLVEKYKLEKRISFSSHVPHKESVEAICNSSMLLLIIPDVVGAEGILTGKLFEYLAARKPILCLGPKEGDAAKIVSETKAGKTFSRDETKAIIEYILSCYTNWEKDIPNIDEDERYRLYSRNEQAQRIAHLTN